MRILLTANASYAPPRGGATRSNLIWLDHLAGAGHECRIVCGAAGEGAELRFHESIAVFAVEDPARRIQALRQQIAEFRPDWVLVSSEDLGHALLREAQHATSDRAGVFVASSLFASLHLPNPFLTAVTFVAALAWCGIYSRHPNVLPLALSHALGTLAILYAFDEAITGRLRVGYSYLQLLR